ncbi:hypothetical protein NM208_g8001 [Fusarium decemcellulare]|uniref:Uncharacterized protein n=1 Tax=Fusarium decemcellulare TaxID=57161 RepID=A0ACC1S732_9HYPO|nr:hypothetical protein NM208_g8001 [Fusarium decemcellulare]
MARTLVHQEVQSLHYEVQKVWSIVSKFGAIHTWAPSVSNCVVKGEGLGSVRTVTESGITFDERLEVLDPESHTISYRILDPTAFPMTGFHGTIHLEQNAGDETVLTWTADAESIDQQGLQVISPVMSAFIKKSISGLNETLQRS